MNISLKCIFDVSNDNDDDVDDTNVLFGDRFNNSFRDGAFRHSLV